LEIQFDHGFFADGADGRGFRSIQSALIRVISGEGISSVASAASCKIPFRFGCGSAVLEICGLAQPFSSKLRRLSIRGRSPQRPIGSPCSQPAAQARQGPSFLYFRFWISDFRLSVSRGLRPRNRKSSIENRKSPSPTVTEGGRRRSLPTPSDLRPWFNFGLISIVQEYLRARRPCHVAWASHPCPKRFRMTNYLDRVHSAARHATRTPAALPPSFSLHMPP